MQKNEIKFSMKHLLTILVVIINHSLACFAQTSDFIWAKSEGGLQADRPQAICSDKIGNIYITGYFISDSITFGNYTLLNKGTNGRFDLFAGIDLFIAKYDNGGNVLWAKSIGGFGDDYGFSICTDNLNNVYVAGCFNNASLNFDSITLYNSSDTILASDLFLSKFDSNGNLLWVKSFHGDFYDQAFSIHTDASGNIFLAGIFDSDKLTIGNTTLVRSNFGMNIFVAKSDSNGNFQWAKNAGSIAMSQWACTVDKFSNVYLAGAFEEQTIVFDTVTIHNTGEQDMFIVKYDSAGNLIWANSSNGPKRETPAAMTCDMFGNVYVAGELGLFNHMFDSITISNGGGSDAFVVKYDLKGKAIWAKRFGDTYNDIATSITADSRGNVYFSGYFGSPTVTIGAFVLKNPGLLIAKLASNGDVIWAIEPSRGIFNSFLVADPFNNLYATGDFYDSLITFGSIVLTNAGGLEPFLTSDDIFITRLGNSVGLSENDYENSLIVFPNPTQGVFTIKVPLSTNGIHIFNSLGELVQTLPSERAQDLNLTLVDSGMYFIQIITDKGSLTKRVIVSR